MDGKDAVAKLRGWSTVPIIILSARDRESEKVAALDLGADDYIEKPFGIGELTARIRTALRHRLRADAQTERVCVDGLEIDTLGRLVARDGEPVRLTPKEYDLPVLLARHAGRVVTHRTLLISIWGRPRANSPRSLSLNGSVALRRFPIKSLPPRVSRSLSMAASR